MRRFVQSSLPLFAACGAVARRGVACPIVQGLPKPIEYASLGKVVSMEEVAAAYKVPEKLLSKSKNPRLVAFTQMDMARNTFHPLIASVTAETKDFRRIADEVEDEFQSNPSKLEIRTGAKSDFESYAWKDMEELVRFYEEVMYPIRAQHRKYELHLLNSYHMKDVLKRGLSAFKQEYLDEQKAALDVEKAEMEKAEQFIQNAVKEGLTTQICNDLANILRIVGEKYEHAHAMAVKVLDDMNMMRIPFDDVTREIVQAVSFHDGPFDNSALLFEIIEYPERGEISLEKGDLEGISNNILKLISKRHQTPLDDGVLLRSEQTHPNLQRSPE